MINVVILNRTVKEDLTEKCQRPEKVREKTRQTTKEGAFQVVRKLNTKTHRWKLA